VRIATPVTSGFTVGALNGVASENTYEIDRYTLSAKTVVSDDATWVKTNEAFDAYETTVIASDSGWSLYGILSDSVPRYWSGCNVNIELGDYLGYAVGSFNQLCTLGMTRYFYNGFHVETVTTALIIPFHDAEAAYLWGNKNTSENATVQGGYCEVTLQPGYFASKMTYTFSDGADPPNYTYYSFYEHAGGDGTHLGANMDSNPDLATSTDSEVLSRLVTKHGNYPFSPPDSMSPFFAGAPYVDKQYYTHSAAVGAAVYGHGSINLEGFPVTFVSTSPPPFIGWA
jgi:hypothetical protein